MDTQRSPAPPPQGGNTTMRAAIMAVVMVVFAGYLFMWVMAPTDTYYNVWLMNLRAHTASTYFGSYQAANLLINTAPVLLIAVLSCLYLHLGKQSRDTYVKGSNEGNSRLAIWRRPVIMKGLGIVSRIELAIFIMFIALLVWNIATYLHNSFAITTPQFAAANREKVWQAKLDMAALRLGLLGNTALTFLFFPVTRGSSVLPLFGLTSEASVKYHIWLGHIVMTLFSAHGLCYITYWASTHELSEMLKWQKTGISNLPGELSLLAGLVLWITTFPRIRRKMFELFFYTHHLYILFIFFFVLHVGINYACIMLPGFFLFMIDRYLRFLQSRRSVRVSSARILPCETIELNFSKAKNLNYSPTSIMFVNIPSISKLQWHPFSIISSSNLESDKLSIAIKREGSWSTKLYEILSSSSSSLDRLEASVEGPYGPVSTHFHRHDLLVMVSGGSGITPFISIIRDLIHASETQKHPTPQLLLISSFKNSDDLTMLDLILPTSGAPPHMKLRIEAYVTREKQPTPPEKKPIRTLWFKPNPSDSPVAQTLGPNSWLWLGAIIASSFIVYLIFIGILTRYYIYPIDHNTNHIFSSSPRAVLHVLVLCGAIIVISTSAFLWTKGKNGNEHAQIQNLEGASPNSWHCEEEREMESLPEESLAQCINVHYGERPDLKSILFERKEASVGVLVCGPKKMRHEVANICSSGLAPNLHFESISFSW